MVSSIRIKWFGHACYKVQWGDYSVVFDPFEDGNVPGLENVRTEAGQVLYSHDHGDHHGTEQVQIKPADSNELSVTIIDTFHDDQQGTLRGENKIHILNNGSYRIAHLGDLGCRLEDQQIQQLKGLDVIMIPVGGYYTIDAGQAKELVDLIQPKIVLPMHYRSDTFGFDTIGRLEEYTDLCNDVVYYESDEIEINSETKTQTAVLKYKNGV